MRKEDKIKLTRGFLFVTMVVWALVILLPILWAFMCSFKTSKEFFTTPWALPESFRIENYVNAWKVANIGKYFFNSVLVTAVSLSVLTMTSAMSSYCIARFSFKGKKILETIYVSSIFIPIMFILVPIFLLMSDLGLVNTYFGLIILYSVRTAPLCIIILIGFFKTLPNVLEEAATIDGSSFVRTFGQIMLPLAKPGIVTVLTLQFLEIWNEYVNALILVSDPRKYTIPLGLINLMEVQQYRTDWGALFAGLVIAMLPTLIGFIWGQKYITKGITAGSVKG